MPYHAYTEPGLRAQIDALSDDELQLKDRLDKLDDERSWVLSRLRIASGTKAILRQRLAQLQREVA